MKISIDDLRRFTVARNFLQPTDLKRVLSRMGFVQADPIRAPARAQDLILRHRVTNYHAGDLERRYPTLDIEEDFFVVYGYVTRSLYALMHPRAESEDSVREGKKAKGKGKENVTRTEVLLEFVRERGAVHPREVDEHFSHGTVKNYWGGSSNATTQLLEEMHYRGLLRVARREKGIRIYAEHQRQPAILTIQRLTRAKPEFKQPVEAGQNNSAKADFPGAGSNSGGRTEVVIAAENRQARIDALVDVAVRLYAPLPGPGLSFLVSRLRYAVPQWSEELPGALKRAKQQLSYARVNDVDWYWPSNEKVTGSAPHDTVRLLAPFDPVVRDRARFEMLWGWIYRFEAYTPAAKRKLGYYAMPLLWGDRVVGWGNLWVKNGELKSDFGYVGSPPRGRPFRRELESELDRMRIFLGLPE